MIKLINFSVDPWDLDKFDNDSEKILRFLEKHGLGGLEMIQYGDWNNNRVVPKEMIIGNHTCFWPIWLDFFRDDKTELIRQFGDEDAYRNYYGCSNKKEFVAYYRKELKKAADLGAKYVLFHVSHTQIENCYTYDYPYDDAEITTAFIEMMNEILDDLEPSFDVLFENHWYPGLTYLDAAIAKKLMTEIHYPRKGFVLDIGHLMNTNLELKSETEAVDYMLDTLGGLKEFLKDIKVIHLNSSLSGEYVKSIIKKGRVDDSNQDFNQRYINLYGHIAQIDTHKPFMDVSINRVIALVRPEYLVYEFSTDSLAVLDGYIASQNAVIDETVI